MDGCWVTNKLIRILVLEFELQLKLVAQQRTGGWDKKHGKMGGYTEENKGDSYENLLPFYSFKNKY